MTLTRRFACVAQDAAALSSAGVGSAHFWVLGAGASPDVTVDFTIVLQNGAIIEQGSHDELLATGGRYARLYTDWEQAAA